MTPRDKSTKTRTDIRPGAKAAKPAPRPRAVRETSEISLRYRSARRAFSSDAEMADTFEVHRSQITRWKRGAAPDGENADRLVGLDAVVSLLRGFLEDDSIPKWLRGINAHLGNRRPMDVVREGRLSEVIRAIEAEKSGAFA